MTAAFVTLLKQQTGLEMVLTLLQRRKTSRELIQISLGLSILFPRVYYQQFDNNFLMMSIPKSQNFLLTDKINFPCLQTPKESRDFFICATDLKTLVEDANLSRHKQSLLLGSQVLDPDKMVVVDLPLGRVGRGLEVVGDERVVVLKNNLKHWLKEEMEFSQIR